MANCSSSPRLLAANSTLRSSSAFEDAAVIEPALNIDQVGHALAEVGWDDPVDDESLAAALDSLVKWDLLEATQDHGAKYNTPQEFERKNLQWSLTARGEAAIAGVLHALDRLHHAVGMQPAVLDAIGDGLAELARLMKRPPTTDDDARIHIKLAEVEGNTNALVVSVRQFNSQLQRLLRDDATDDEVFLDVKRRTIVYLREYVDGVDRRRRRLETTIAALADIGITNVFDRALGGANLAPDALNDPSIGWLAERDRRWRALRQWFSPTDDSLARVESLTGFARSAINELLRVLEHRWNQRRQSNSIAHDFRRLAELFSGAPSDVDAHRLFGASFGMWSARHAHLVHPDDEAQPRSTSWLAAPPVEVAPSLRTTGTVSSRGRTPAVGDPKLQRAERQRHQAELLAVEHAVRESLVAGGAAMLSEFGRLDPATFSELLRLLGQALTAPLDSDGVRRSMSLDGQVEVTLRRLAGDRVAAIETDHGLFRGPDHDVSITLLDIEPARVSTGTTEEATVSA